jgi:riboflavin biosynthesis pyrimidine reductase
MHQLWPDCHPGDLSDADVVAAYTPPHRDRPWLRVNFVTSADGAVTVEGHSEGLSSAPDKQVFRVLRMLCDVLLVGAGTLREEGYGPLRLDAARRDWRTAAGLSPYPVLAVVSGRLALEPDHPALTEAPVRPVIVTHHGSPPAQRHRLATVADVVVAGETEVDLVAARAALHERGLTQVLCEGGPCLFGSLLAADLVDELCLTVSPMLTGPGPGRIVAGPQTATRRLRLDNILHANGNLLLRYTRAP